MLKFSTKNYIIESSKSCEGKQRFIFLIILFFYMESSQQNNYSTLLCWTLLWYFFIIFPLMLLPKLRSHRCCYWSFFCGSFKTQLSNLSVLLGYGLKKDEVERCNMRYIKLSSMSNTNQFNYLMVFLWSNKIPSLHFQVCYNISRILIIKFHYLFSKTYNILVKKIEHYLIIAFSLST